MIITVKVKSLTSSYWSCHMIKRLFSVLGEKCSSSLSKFYNLRVLTLFFLSYSDTSREKSPAWERELKCAPAVVSSPWQRLSNSVITWVMAHREGFCTELFKTTTLIKDDWPSDPIKASCIHNVPCILKEEVRLFGQNVPNKFSL